MASRLGVKGMYAVTFKDKRLELAVRKTLGESISEETPITVADMSKLYQLANTNKRGIEDLSGLEHAVNLQHVDLSDNRIKDVTPLAGLRDIRQLDLHNNEIEDISPIKKLTGLVHLDLHNNRIKEISALQELTKLTYLDLIGNQIVDISPLRNLIKLGVLELRMNRITDISPLAKLTELRHLDLFLNQVSDISVLSNLNKLGYLNLNNNYLDLNDNSPAMAVIKGLLRKGVNMQYKSQMSPPSLSIPKNSVIIGTKAFSLDYAGRPENTKEIQEALDSNPGPVYYNHGNASNLWVNLSTGLPVTNKIIELLPKIIYKDAGGNVTVYAAAGKKTGQGKKAIASVMLGVMGLKEITIKSVVAIDGAAKFKLEGSSVIKEIGEKIRLITSASSIKVFVYASDGTTLLAEGSLSVPITNEETEFPLE